MIIDLANVVARPKAIELTLPPYDIDLDIEGTALIGEVKFSGETERLNDKAHVRGKIEVEVSVDCTRCLDPVDSKFEIAFDDVFVDPADAPAEVEVVLGAEELDESVAFEGKIDVAEVIREQILLALPDQVFCKEDCKGLCPKCGTNRNLLDCRCIEDEVDPRWSGLKNLK